jgi:outer membrane receptor protein involved in Fe transport
MIFLLFLLFTITQPGTSSESILCGYVSDGSGNPVAGACVTVLENEIADVTDSSGWFSMGVVPGVYSVQVDMQGMNSAIYRDVTVTEEGSITVTSTHSETSEMALPNIDYSYFQLSINADQIRTLPVSSVIDIACRLPGIENSGVRCGSLPWGTLDASLVELSTLDAENEDHLHMRGGRSGEIVYIVDGIAHRNSMDGGFLSSFPLSSIDRLTFTEGTSDTRYGNGMSGTVEIETPEGGSSYHGGISLSGNDWQALGLADNWTWGGTSQDEPDEWRLSNVSPFSEARLDFNARIGGPEPLTRYVLPELGINIPGDLTIFADGEFIETGGGEDGRYGYGFDEWETSYTGIVKLTYKPSTSTRVNLSTTFLNRKSGWFGIGDYWRWRMFEVPYIETDTLLPNYGDTLAWGKDILYGLPTRFWSNSSIGLGIDHELNEETSLQFRLSQYRTSFDFKIRNDPESIDPMRQSEWLGENWSWYEWQQYETERYLDDDGFIRSGTSRFPWRESETTTTTLRTGIESAVFADHEIGAGIDWSFHDIFNYDIIATDSIVSQNRYSASPYSGGLYVMDRIQQNDGFVINAGVRLNYFNADYDRTQLIVTPPPPTFQNTILDRIEAQAKISIDPSLNFYCPLSERLTLHFGYEASSQIPDFSQMFRREDYSFSEDIPLGGNPDLDFERSNQFEISLHSSFTENCSVDITGYVREFSNLVETELFNHYLVGNYALYTNGGAGEAKGIEITINANPEGFFSWSASYSLSRATGSSSSALQNYLYAVRGLSNALYGQYLDWDQRHTLHADVACSVPRGRGDRIFGIRVFQGLSVHLSWDFGSGFPYSHVNQGTYEPRVNEGRYPATNTASLKVNKAFWLSGMTIDAWCEVSNLFNRHNLDKIEDIAWYEVDLFGCDWGDERGDPTGQLDNHYAFSRPRMIRFGIGLNW